MIICIGREFGSGGHEIGQQLAKSMHYSFFDQELLQAVMEKYKDTIPDEIEKTDEKRKNPWLHGVWYDIDDKELRGLSANDIVFRIQSKIILKKAEKGDCIFVGRCADYVLKQTAIERLSLFICAPFNDRVKRKMELMGADEKTVSTLIRKTDKQRKSYYDYYTAGNWSKPYNYDICINSSSVGIQDSASYILSFLKEQHHQRVEKMRTSVDKNVRSYNIQMDTQIGPRYGRITVTNESNKLNGTIEILEHIEPFEGIIDNEGKCEISGRIVTLTRTILYTARGTITPNALSLLLYGDKSIYKITGSACE